MILTPVVAVAQREIIGDWHGALKANQTKGVKIRLVVHTISAPDGALTATIDSINQDPPAIPVNRELNLSLLVDTTHYSRPLITIDGIDSQKHGIKALIGSP